MFKAVKFEWTRNSTYSHFDIVEQQRLQPHFRTCEVNNPAPESALTPAFALAVLPLVAGKEIQQPQRQQVGGALEREEEEGRKGQIKRREA